ncbi:MAG: DMT family transporter [Cytophagales bacterium]|nr:MAG: DMT family transporter [Cytophagales bacterium]
MGLLFYVLAFLTGVAMSVQSAVNSGLRQGFGNPLLAAVTSFGTGFLALILAQVFVGNPLPTLESIRQISWWKWTGGLIGACYVTTVIVTISKIGPGNLLSLSVAGQLIAAVILDHYGLLGFTPHPANAWRLLGVAMIIGGVLLVVKN